MQNFISVIVTAHDRKAYIMDALNSLLNQSLPRKYFEIIVVKNFYDEKIDKFINENDVLSYYTNEKSMGTKLKIGIENSKGNIICFLDDDDMFSTKKLEEVSNYMSKTDDSFFYNSRLLINEEGKKIGEDIVEDKKVIVSSKKEIDYLFKHKIYFNSSSMCVKREVLEDKLKYLNKIQRLIDNFILLSAIEYNGKLTITSKPLTLYRVHKSSSRHLERDFDKFIQSRISYWNEIVDAHKPFFEVFRNELVLYALECGKKMAELQKCLAEGKRCLKFINCGTFDIKTLVSANLASLISLFAPKYPIKLIYRRQEKIS